MAGHSRSAEGGAGEGGTGKWQGVGRAGEGRAVWAGTLDNLPTGRARVTRRLEIFCGDRRCAGSMHHLQSRVGAWGGVCCWEWKRKGRNSGNKWEKWHRVSVALGARVTNGRHLQCELGGRGAWSRRREQWRCGGGGNFQNWAERRVAEGGGG